jgi:SET domain-containing protein
MEAVSPSRVLDEEREEQQQEEQEEVEELCVPPSMPASYRSGLLTRASIKAAMEISSFSSSVSSSSSLSSSSTNVNKSITSSVQIKVSLIPGAGYGLFTCQDVKKGERIIQYIGEKLTHEQFVERYQCQQDGYGQWSPTQRCDYVLYCHGVYIDASDVHKSNEARWINHLPASDKRVNCRLTQAGKIQAIKNIKAGEELYFNYGISYWRGRNRPGS